MDLTVTTNGKIYCAFCTRVLSDNEECHCKGAENARAKAKEKVRKAQQSSPNGKANRRPPRGFNK